MDRFLEDEKCALALRAFKIGVHHAGAASAERTSINSNYTQLFDHVPDKAAERFMKACRVTKK
jgi:hypothetical protein